MKLLGLVEVQGFGDGVPRRLGSAGELTALPACPARRKEAAHLVSLVHGHDGTSSADR